jgi:hypothetical protein
MKTLQECKDEVAKMYGCASWRELYSLRLSCVAVTEFYMNEVAELYASQFRDKSE